MCGSTHDRVNKYLAKDRLIFCVLGGQDEFSDSLFKYSLGHENAQVENRPRIENNWNDVVFVYRNTTHSYASFI